MKVEIDDLILVVQILFLISIVVFLGMLIWYFLGNSPTLEQLSFVATLAGVGFAVLAYLDSRASRSEHKQQISSLSTIETKLNKLDELEHHTSILESIKKVLENKLKRR